jgi:hypothetical protein
MKCIKREGISSMHLLLTFLFNFVAEKKLNKNCKKIIIETATIDQKAPRHIAE